MTATAGRRPPLRYQGSDVQLFRRRSDGRAVVEYLDAGGGRTGNFATPWPHELRGIGWHFAEIKRLVAALPLLGFEQQQGDSAPRPVLFAHYVAAHRED